MPYHITYTAVLYMRTYIVTLSLSLITSGYTLIHTLCCLDTCVTFLHVNLSLVSVAWTTSGSDCMPKLLMG